MSFRVGRNLGPARSGTIAISGAEVTVTQDGVVESAQPPAPEPPSGTPPVCTRTLQPTAASMTSAGGSGVLTIATRSDCAWTARSMVPWVTISNAASGSGNATVGFIVAANTGAARVGTLDVSGQTFTVTQAGVSQVACSVAIDSNSQSVAVGGTNGVSVAVSAPGGCPWTAASNAGWITITSGASGSGNGKVAFNVAANTGSARSGTLTIGGNTFTVSQAAQQAACAYSISPATQSMSSAGGTGTSIAVSTTAGCAWTAASNAGWLTIISGSSGTGNGTVAYSVAANTGTAARTGTLTIGGQAFTLNQAASCSYSIDPVAQSLSAAAGAGTSIAVSTAAGCAWTAASNAGWLTITSGSSGSGNGTVGFSVAANTGSGRAGTLTIAGRTFAVLQAGACTYSISPSSATIGRDGGDGPEIDVSAPAGCPWTATSNDGWLTIRSGASDTGNGEVKFRVASFSGSAPRTGTLTIAGQTFTVTQTPTK